MIKEFRDFINRGNLIDIAVGFVMGVAFAAVVTSLTDDIINPIIAKIFNVQDLSDWVVSDIRVGSFVVAIINFVIVAFVMFLVVRAYNSMKARNEEEEPPGPSEEVQLLTEIRNELRTGR
jgi:large conductance mechanosensitive channel